MINSYRLCKSLWAVAVLLLLQISLQHVAAITTDHTPKKLILDGRQYGNISVRWDVTDEGGEYNVTYKTQNMTKPDDCFVEVGEYKATCSIPPEYSGMVILIAVKTGSIESCCTISVLSVPGPPENATAVAVSSSTIRVSWMAPVAGLTTFKYNISFTPPLNDLVTGESHELHNLTSNTMYNISVWTVVTMEDNGVVNMTESTPSEIIFSTTYPNPVEDLHVIPDTDDMNITWERAKGSDASETAETGHLVGYVVLVFDQVNGSCVLEAHLNTNSEEPIQKGHDCGDPHKNQLDMGSTYVYTTRYGAVVPCNEYNVVVYSVNAAGNSDNTTEEATTIVADPRDQVKNVLLTAYKDRIQVSWDEVEGPGHCPIVEYLVNYEYNNCTSGDPEKDEVVIVSGGNITAGVQPYWNYTVTVSTRTVPDGSVGNSTSGPREKRTLTDVPGPPGSLDITDRTQGTTHLSWTTPERCHRNGPITNYNVSYVCENLAGEGSLDNMTLVSGDKLEYTWDTEPYRMCTFSVAAINDRQQGAPITKDHTTPEEGPSEVMGVTATDLGETWVLLQWEEPTKRNGIILNYIISYASRGFADGLGFPIVEDGTKRTPNNETSFNVTGLHEFTSYEFRVVGTTAGGNGTVSKPITNGTVIGDPLPVTLSSESLVADRTTITVTWEKPVKRTGPTTYHILARNGTNGPYSNKTIKGYNSTTGVVTDLESYQNYTVTVHTEVDGEWAHSDSQEIITHQDVPGPVEKAQITSTNSTTLLVKWSLPNPPNGVILQYTVIYRAMDWVDRWGEAPKPSYTDVNTTGPLKEHALFNLEPFTQYEVEIYGWTMMGRAPNSTVFENDTIAGEPQTVYNVLVEATKTSLTVTWNASTERQGPTSYQISVQDFTFNEMVDVVTVNGFNNRSGRVDVRPYRTYQVSVTTIITTNGVMVLSEPFYSDNYTTLEDAPNAAPNATSEKVDGNNCTVQILSWRPLDKNMRNGYITNYTIEVDENSVDRTYVVQASREKEDKMSLYEKLIEMVAGNKYDIHVSASTVGGTKKSDALLIKNGFCAPPYPDESPTDETKIVQGATDVEQKHTKVSVVLSCGFFTNEAGGPVTERYLIVAQEQQASEDLDGSNGTILTTVQFKNQYYRSWTHVQEQENMEPFRLKLSDDTFKDGETQSSNKHTSDGSGEPQIQENVKFEIGDNQHCTDSKLDICNGALKAGKDYKFRAVACTVVGCTLTTYSAAVPTSPYPSHAGTIVAAVLIPIIVLVAIGIFIYMHRQELGPFAPNPTKPMSGTGRNGGADNGGFTMEAIQPNDVEQAGPVLLANFPKHVATRHRNSDLLFSEEYKLLKELSPRMTWNSAELPQNRNKNRYNNILPYDHSRIKLLSVDEEDETGSDFINANFMPGYNSKREFIASQGPLPSTKDDFWRLIWEQKVPLVVMVTKCVEKGRHKCEQYWPNDQEPVYYGDLQVKVRSESVLNNYTIRILDISMGEYTRSVHHFNFEMWPDFGCPETTEALLEFVLTVMTHNRGHQRGPTVIHCSAGVGRTGTFITVDRLLQQMRDHPTVDVFGTILEMRRYRTNMVQTEDQYIYIHDCLRDALSQGLHMRYPSNTAQPPPELEQPQTKDENEEQPLYENVEMTIPHIEITSNKSIGNNNHVGIGNNTGL